MELLPLRLPAVLALSAAPPACPAPAGQPEVSAAVLVYDGGPVEFEREVPASAGTCRSPGGSSGSGRTGPG
jgi:hypothetical protein